MRHGADEKLRDGAHTLQNVYSEMMFQCMQDYPSLPDVRTLRAREIRFFYEGLRANLKKATMPKT